MYEQPLELMRKEQPTVQHGYLGPRWANMLYPYVYGIETVVAQPKQHTIRNHGKATAASSLMIGLSYNDSAISTASRLKGNVDNNYCSDINGQAANVKCAGKAHGMQLIMLCRVECVHDSCMHMQTCCKPAVIE